IDEVMIFNRSLSPEEIKSLYVTGSTDHKNNGVGVNWAESSSGEQEMSAYNETHKNVNFEINTESNYILPEIKMNSNYYNFYTPTIS
ncbi:MAG: hypothetical protein ACQER9_02210, partial [Nanobdellota archaeon]